MSVDGEGVIGEAMEELRLESVASAGFSNSSERADCDCRDAAVKEEETTGLVTGAGELDLGGGVRGIGIGPLTTK